MTTKETSHPLRMKRNVCEEYIRSALRITDSIYWPDTITKLRKILHDSYPNRFINNRFWNLSYYNLSHYDHIKGRMNHVDTYIGFPFCQDVTMRTKTMIRRLRLKKAIILAPKIMAGMKRRIFSNLKCRTGLESMINTSATVTCNNCRFRCKISTSHLSLKRTISWLKSSQTSQIGRHLMAFPSHTLNENISNIRRYENKRDLQLMLSCTI